MNVLAGSSKFLLLDLSKVPFLGSMGLRSIVLPAQAAKRRGGKMVILAPVPMVEEVLKASNVHEVIPMLYRFAGSVSYERFSDGNRLTIGFPIPFDSVSA